MQKHAEPLEQLDARAEIHHVAGQNADAQLGRTGAQLVDDPLSAHLRSALYVSNNCRASAGFMFS